MALLDYVPKHRPFTADLNERRRQVPQVLDPEPPAEDDAHRFTRDELEPWNTARADLAAAVAETNRQIRANTDRLGEIAALVRSLTYGEMMEMVGGLKTTGTELPAETELAAVLHRWASGKGVCHAA